MSGYEQTGDINFPAERWATRQEVADHLGVSLDTVDRLVREGCPSVKLDDGPRAGRRFRLSHVDEWLESKGTAA